MVNQKKKIIFGFFSFLILLCIIRFLQVNIFNINVNLNIGKPAFSKNILSINNQPVFKASNIFDAIKNGNIADVKELIDKDPVLVKDEYTGKSYNSCNNTYIWTPLHEAVYYDQREIVELLISKGADVNTKDNKGKTPLHYAVENGHKELVELFISKGADVNARDNKGKTPLHYAVENGHKELVELFISKGANVNLKDNEGKTPLNWTIENIKNEKIKDNSEEKISNIPLPQMVFIAGGTFQMGSTLHSSEEPVHSVTLSPFNMSKYGVTNTEYCRFLNSQGNQTEGEVTWIDMSGDSKFLGITGGTNPGTFIVRPGYEKRPVVYVSWYGAVAYCNWLSSQHRYTPCYGPINNRGNDPSVWRTINGYRLPTEAERQYACRAGSTTDYYWGENYNNPLNIGNYCWYNGNSGGNHHDVGTKLPNSWGLYDMSGNIVDWCSDWYSVYPAGHVTNPTGPMSGSNRVMQGGSWYNGIWNSHSGNRGAASPTRRMFDDGFRLCRTSFMIKGR